MWRWGWGSGEGAGREEGAVTGLGAAPGAEISLGCCLAWGGRTLGPLHPVLKSRSERSRPLGGGAVKTRTPPGLWKEDCAWSLGEAEMLHAGSEKVLVFAPLYRRALVLGLVPFSLYGPFSTCYAPATYRALSHLTFEAQ